MKPNMKPQKPSSRLILTSLLLFLPLLISTLTCSITGENQSQSETKIAQNVQATLNAQKLMTLEVQQTEISAQQTASDVGGTMQTQQATTVVQSTVQTESETPIAGSSTEQPTASLEVESNPILITEWEKGYWDLNSKCKLPAVPCWRLGSGDVLISEKSFYIDNNWKNPYLVFWHYALNEGSTWFGGSRVIFKPSLFIGINGNWTEVRDYSDKAGGSWSREYINLNIFREKEISIQFYLETNTSSYWSIQEVQILPEFTSP